MLTIRLQRVGKKKYPTYRIIISENTKDSQAPYLEILGSYDPHNKENGLVVKEDRIKYWLSVGAQTSNTVHNILLKLGIISGKKKKSITISDKRNKKLAEKKKEIDEAKKVATKKTQETAEAKKAEEAQKIQEAEEVKAKETPIEEKQEESKTKESKEEIIEKKTGDKPIKETKTEETSLNEVKEETKEEIVEEKKEETK